MLRSMSFLVSYLIPLEPRIGVQSFHVPSYHGNGCQSTVPRTLKKQKTPSLFPHELPPTSAYVHLPFCRKRCHYCDFPIIALGDSSNITDDDPRMSSYVQLLLREIKATPSFCTSPLQTVFFGGGTPSLVAPRFVFSILEMLRVQFGLSLSAEISMEMDPGTFGISRMKEFLCLGVNRVSLGVQAFQDELLKGCGRAHDVKEVHEAIDIIKSCGLENWSMDLISSLPYQTEEMWNDTLKLAITSGPSHVSVYDLQVEDGTKFGFLYKPGEFPLPPENQSANFYQMASERLSEAGYDHYEISSYCKSGFECKHNVTYWENRSFYGFGLGSSSYLGGRRFSRPRRMKEYRDYAESMEKGIVDDDSNDVVDEFDIFDIARDLVMLSLRTSRGLDLKSFGEKFGVSLAVSLCETYKPYIESGHVVFLDRQRSSLCVDQLNIIMSDVYTKEEVPIFIRLSDPLGFLLSNELISVAFRVISPMLEAQNL